MLFIHRVAPGGGEHVLALELGYERTYTSGIAYLSCRSLNLSSYFYKRWLDPQTSLIDTISKQNNYCFGRNMVIKNPRFFRRGKYHLNGVKLIFEAGRTRRYNNVTWKGSQDWSSLRRGAARIQLPKEAITSKQEEDTRKSKGKYKNQRRCNCNEVIKMKNKKWNDLLIVIIKKGVWGEAMGQEVSLRRKNSAPEEKKTE